MNWLGQRANYVLMEDFNFNRLGDANVLPAGAFVMPIEAQYLPRHIKDSTDYRWYDPQVSAFCYCHAGIILIPLSLIRTVI